jgi:hypothetical protein
MWREFFYLGLSTLSLLALLFQIHREDFLVALCSPNFNPCPLELGLNTTCGIDKLFSSFLLYGRKNKQVLSVTY